MELQSDSIGKLAGALAKVQGSVRHAIKDEKGHHNDYATLGAVWTACREQLANNEIAVIQTATVLDGQNYLVTTLAHSSGEWVRGLWELKPVQNNPQGMGSAISYMRRYSLAAMVGIVADKDDDGQAASQAKTEQQAPRQQQAPQQQNKVNPTKTKTGDGGPKSITQEQADVLRERITKLGRPIGDEAEFMRRCFGMTSLGRFEHLTRDEADKLWKWAQRMARQTRIGEQDTLEAAAL